MIFEDGTLVIKGESNVLDESQNIRYTKVLQKETLLELPKLAEFVEVKEAKLEDGIPRVPLFRNVSDAMKPKKIKIS